MGFSWRTVRQEWGEYWWEVLFWLGAAGYLISRDPSDLTYLTAGLAAVVMALYVLTYVRWLRWVVWGLLLGPVVHTIVPQVMAGQYRPAVNMSVAIGVLVWCTLRKRDPRELDAHYTLCVLLRNQVHITTAHVVAAVLRAWGERLRVGDSMFANYFVEDVGDGTFALVSREGRYAVRLQGGQFEPIRQLAYATMPAALAQEVAQHADMLMVGVYAAIPGREALSRQRAAQLACELAGSSGIVAGDLEGAFLPLTPELRQQLCSSDPQQLFPAEQNQDAGEREKSIVTLFLSEERIVTPEELAIQAADLWGIPVELDQELEAPAHVVQLEEGLGLDFPGAFIYVREDERLEDFPEGDSELAEAMASHQAQLSLVLEVFDPDERELATSRFARLIAAFLDERALVLSVSDARSVVLVTDEIREQLLGDDPFGGLPRNLPEDDEDASEDSADRKPLLSLVLLLREPRYVDATILTAAARRAWDLPAERDDDEAENYCFVVGDAPLFMAKLGGMFFAIHAFDRPYFDDPAETAGEISELRRAKAVADHTAWLGVDLMSADELPERTNAYTYIGRLVAQLAGDDTLAIVCPEEREVVPYDAQLDGYLRSDDPLGAFRQASEPAVLKIDSDDPRMQAAVAEARERWPEFVAAFEVREPGDTHSVKAPVTDGEHTEFMWLNVTAIENDVIFGELGNAPVNVTGVSLGDRLRIPVSDLSDWMVAHGEEIQGGFSLKVIAEIHAQRIADQQSDGSSSDEE